MATPGFADKILLANLTSRQISSLDSSKYEIYGDAASRAGDMPDFMAFRNTV